MREKFSQCVLIQFQQDVKLMGKLKIHKAKSRLAAFFLKGIIMKLIKECVLIMMGIDIKKNVLELITYIE